jgi:RNA-binding protein NOB1
VTDFARRTGDLQVLSKPDLQLIALTYELELERNGGDWRLRKDPTQKRVNGKPPGRSEEGDTQEAKPDTETSPAATQQAPPADGAQELAAEDIVEAVANLELKAEEGDAFANIVEEEAEATSEEEVEGS